MDDEAIVWENLYGISLANIWPPIYLPPTLQSSQTVPQRLTTDIFYTALFPTDGTYILSLDLSCRYLVSSIPGRRLRGGGGGALFSILFFPNYNGYS